MRSPNVVNVQDFRELARRRLPKVVFDYLDGGAEDEITLRENRSAFQDLTFNRGSRLITGEAPSDFNFDREIARATAAALAPPPPSADAKAPVSSG